MDALLCGRVAERVKRYKQRDNARQAVRDGINNATTALELELAAR
jgi:hypothetical protein